MAAFDAYQAALLAAERPRDRASARRNMGVVSAAQGELALSSKLYTRAAKLLSASIALAVVSLQECGSAKFSC